MDPNDPPASGSLEAADTSVCHCAWLGFPFVSLASSKPTPEPGSPKVSQGTGGTARMWTQAQPAPKPGGLPAPDPTCLGLLLGVASVQWPFLGSVPALARAIPSPAGLTPPGGAVHQTGPQRAPRPGGGLAWARRGAFLREPHPLLLAPCPPSLIPPSECPCASHSPGQQLPLPLAAQMSWSSCLSSIPVPIHCPSSSHLQPPWRPHHLQDLIMLICLLHRGLTSSLLSSCP